MLMRPNRSLEKHCDISGGAMLRLCILVKIIQRSGKCNYMIIYAKSMKDFSFGDLMKIYVEGNLEKARDEYFDMPESAGLRLAEQDFYDYLKECFFQTVGGVYAILVENGSYVCALRYEPYKDGSLISALETKPSERMNGYAYRLLSDVLPQIGGKVYSHVGKRNAASLAVHMKSGFRIISDQARYLDGSVNSRAYTLCFEKEKRAEESFSPEIMQCL